MCFCELEKCCVSVEKNKAVSQRNYFLWSGKITYKEALQNLLRCYLLFAGSLESLIQKKGDATERKDSIVKSRKIFFFGGGVAFENPVGYFMYEIRMETVEYIWVNIEKLQVCTPSAHSRSTVKELKKWNTVLSIWTGD